MSITIITHLDDERVAKLRALIDDERLAKLRALVADEQHGRPLRMSEQQYVQMMLPRWIDQAYASCRESEATE